MLYDPLFFRPLRPAALLAFTLLFAFAASSQAALVSRNLNVVLDAQNLDSYALDVDQNGTTDFTISAYLALDPLLSIGANVVDFPFGSNNAVVVDAPGTDGFPTASKLAGGSLISSLNLYSMAAFDQANLYFFTTFDPASGNFEGQTGFLGLRFDGAGGALYGYAEITVNSLNDLTNPLGITIGSVGFDNVPGTGIRAGAVSSVPLPGSLPLAALGCAGILMLGRRSRSHALGAYSRVAM